MKIHFKITGPALALLFAAASVSGQSINDAQKAIRTEQYQKAKAILKNLIAAKPTEENQFYLGWTYLLEDYSDSAKTVFEKGIALEPKSALNYAGLGAVAKLSNNTSAMTQNFDQALALAGKHADPYIYVARAALLKPADANLALTVLTKGEKYGAKDADYQMAKGEANHAKLDNSAAISNYTDAQTIDPKDPGIAVAIGAIWKQAFNFDAADQKLKEALALDPNYGPAYRELAENNLLWARHDLKVASDKIKEGTAYYKKYLDLTDRSPESQMRYADFLLESGDYKTLEQVAADLSKSANTNLRIYRYLGYAAYENGNYQQGLASINKWIGQADAKRVIPRDYLYLGRLQLKTNQDSLGMLNLTKAASLDSTFADAWSEVAAALYSKQKYAAAGDAYNNYIEKSHKGKLNDYFREGMSYYYGYSDQYYKTFDDKNAPKPDSLLLTKADSAFSYVQQKTSAKPVADVLLYRARVKDLEEPDRNNIKAIAKPYYEQYISLKSTATDDRSKKSLGEAYAYLGSYYSLVAKDDAQAQDNFQKALAANPDNKQAKAYFDKKSPQTPKGK